jgi:hypothetical protein
VPWPWPSRSPPTSPRYPPAVGVEAEAEKVSKLLSELEGKDLSEVLAAGKKKLASVPAAGPAAAAPAAGGAAAAPAAEAKKEESESDQVSHPHRPTACSRAGASSYAAPCGRAAAAIACVAAPRWPRCSGLRHCAGAQWTQALFAPGCSRPRPCRPPQDMGFSLFD